MTSTIDPRRDTQRTSANPGTVVPHSPSRRSGNGRHAVTLVLHLVAREFKLRYRRAFLGWAWAMAEPLMRFAVLSFVFTSILPLGIPDYSAHLFIGLMAWAWFSSALASATNSAVDRRELFMRPELPRAAVPVTSVLTDALDYMAALPILVFVLWQSGQIHMTIVALPVVMSAQFLLTVGLGFALCTANVFLRDVRHMVSVTLGMLFYLSPIFYSVETVPEQYRSLIYLNPITHLLDAYRAVLLDGRLPDTGSFAVLFAFCGSVCGAGYLLYRLSSRSFLDEL
ncbi:ABC transporter permease [soil metagenome]